MFSPFMGEYLFFDGQRKGTKRKANRMLALRVVPCDAQSPLLGKPERDFKVKTKGQN